MLEKKEFLKELEELDTGKAQPLFHPYPVINIFREDEPIKEVLKKEKPEEEKLLINKKGLICDASETVKSQIAGNLEIDGAVLISEEQKTTGLILEKEQNGGDSIQEDAADFVIAMDSDAGFLKYAIMQGCTALKTTYGLVSRYGMDADAPSLAQPAIGTKNAAMIGHVLQAAAGVDKKDPMSRDAYIYEYLEALKDTDMTGMKIAILEELPGMEAQEMQLGCYNHILDVFEAKGAEIETVEIPWAEYALPVHEIIAACEKVMTADEIGMSLSEEDEVLSFGKWLLKEDNYEKYYLKALKLRSFIKDSYDMLLRNYALFIVPYTNDADPYSVAANLAGLPAMTIPFVPYDAMEEDDEIVAAGLHMIAGANYENNLIKAAYTYEQEVL